MLFDIAILAVSHKSSAKEDQRAWHLPFLVSVERRSAEQTTTEQSSAVPLPLLYHRMIAAVNSTTQA